MKRKIASLILLITVAACAVFVFTGCNEELFYGTYKSVGYKNSSQTLIADHRDIQLTLAEDYAYFGNVDNKTKYFVNYSSGRIGINTDDLACYWGTFIYEFTVEDYDTLTLTGYIANPEGGKLNNTGGDEAVHIIFKKNNFTL